MNTTPHVEAEIEAILEARTGRACAFMPSGRFALHLAFRLLLSPGDRILMSPLEDDTVFFGALAAGLRPVMAPVSTADGNLRLDAVEPSTWSSLDAVLTANIYGLPDRVADLRQRCDEFQIPLIEDAAHALETEVDGRPIGTFGAASVFSLSKHLPGRGGVLSLATPDDVAAASPLRTALLAEKPARRRAADTAKSGVRGVLEAVRLMAAVQRARRSIRRRGLGEWRVPLRASRLRGAVSANNGLEPFDEWMNTAYPDYRMGQRSSGVRRTLAALRDVERDRRERLAGVVRLRELDAVAPGAQAGPPQPLLRVPLLIENRDSVANALHQRGINVYFVYDPPLDEYAGPEFVEPSSAPGAASWWSRHVLPVDPHDAREVVKLVRTKHIRMTAATPPSG
jgi:DegT/DnrJ/EryC1/StrS aminotransferase family protein